MANYLETAKQLKEDLQMLLSSVESTKASLGKLLDSARRNEGKLIDIEEAQKAAKLEQERKERLASILASESDLAVHVGGTE